MSLRRKHTRRDTTPCTVDVAPGVLVFWDGEQRGGALRNVPKYLAMQWLRYRFANVVYEPRAGAASNATFTAQAAAKTGLRAASDELRDTDPTTHSNDDDVCWQPEASPQVREVQGWEPSPTHASPPRCSADFAADGSQKIDPETPKSLAVLRCGYCSRLMKAQVSGGRPRKWCSEKCRKSAGRNLP